MIDFIFYIMGSVFVFFTIYFTHNNKLSDKASLAIYIVVIAMLIIVKNALGI